MSSVFHIAYTFDSDSFHSNLKTMIAADNELDLNRLQDLARAYVETSPQILGVLQYMRYDESWLDDPDGDGSQANLWYTICLASSFHPAPSLNNNRFHGSHYVLENVLPFAGWNRDDILALIHGKPLSTLLDPHKYRVFVEALSLYGGCLRQNDIRTVREHLKDSEIHFSPSARSSIEAIEKYANHNNVSPASLLGMAYEDVVEMLETAIQRKEALYLLRDF